MLAYISPLSYILTHYYNITVQSDVIDLTNNGQHVLRTWLYLMPNLNAIKDKPSLCLLIFYRSELESNIIIILNVIVEFCHLYLTLLIVPWGYLMALLWFWLYHPIYSLQANNVLRLLLSESNKCFYQNVKTVCHFLTWRQIRQHTWFFWWYFCCWFIYALISYYQTSISFATIPGNT